MKSRGSIVLCLFVVACGSGATTKDKTPSTDVVVTDVDGGTIVGTATPETRKKWPSKSEPRVLSRTECRAVTMHVVELFARDSKIDPKAMQEATWDPGSFTVCDQPVFSDEIFDCVLAAKSYSDVPPCMKYGDVLKH